MFKKSRKRIVASIMAVLVLLWIGTLCVIYACSYYEVLNRNREMLERHVRLYRLVRGPVVPDIPGNPPLPDRGEKHFENSPAYRLSTFYTVAISKSADHVLDVDNSQTEVYGDDELVEIAREIINSGRRDGIKRNLIYRLEDKGSYLLVAFMDNTVVRESMTTLFRYTLIFGGLVILALFFLAVYLARRIVRPLEESYEKQKQFISDAGHELKTPVSVVYANAELLSREIGDNQWLSNIQYENGRMGLLVGQLLELARTEQVTPQMERLDFSRLVGGEALPFESVAYEKEMPLRCEMTEGLFVNGNGAQLKQLVAILLDNAIEHGERGREIALILRAERNSAVLSVVNAGDEIPPEQRKQLFERFYRMDVARNGDGQHYGLGLSIAKAITEVHGGRIHVECADGKIKFVVRVPLNEKKEIQ